MSKTILDLIQTGDTKRAMLEVHELLKSGNRSAEVLALGAYLKDVAGYHADSYLMARQAVGTDPNCRMALAVGILVLNKHRQKAGADKLAERLIGIGVEGDSFAEWVIGMWHIGHRRYGEAEVALGTLLQRDKTYTAALVGLASVFMATDRVAQAEEIFDRVLHGGVLTGACYGGLAQCAFLRGDTAQEESLYRMAIAENRQDIESRVNLGMCLMRQGKWDEGWVHYQARFQHPGQGRHPACADTPMWQGQPLDGKRLLVWGEQGLGDEINFFGIISKIPGKFEGYYATHWPTYRIARQSPQAKGWNIVTWAESQDMKFDYHISQFSACHLLAHDRLWEATGRFVIADEHRKAAEARRPAERLRVGIIWKGNKDHNGDLHRSMDLELFKPLAKIADLVSFQYPAPSDLPDWVKDYTTPNGDMYDMACRLYECHALVSVCTSGVHLAGALGFPTIDMVSHHGDWRWGDGNNTQQKYYDNFLLVRYDHRDKASAIDQSLRILADHEQSLLNYGRWGLGNSTEHGSPRP